jgi:hypothetical protein
MATLIQETETLIHPHGRDTDLQRSGLFHVLRDAAAQTIAHIGRNDAARGKACAYRLVVRLEELTDGDRSDVNEKGPSSAAESLANTEALRAQLRERARERALHWRHRKTSMIAKSITVARPTDDEDMLLVHASSEDVGTLPTLVEQVPRSQMERAFILITEEEYKRVFNALGRAPGDHYTVDLENGTAKLVGRSS